MNKFIFIYICFFKFIATYLYAVPSDSTFENSNTTNRLVLVKYK